ncbi:NADPH-dependent FMN reductase [Oharaeibacter diazotrophicus]|uniref:NAD(P)H-dependent FMN reductase n=1 Tax=Oharaeibacter diazotrophicus TaxID=1920512 RepID=A0A4V3CVD2_9HYPH|nr:NAD(P)H-dependent oxidoreductase [Oharaeibacter diazotrophicus]TDP81988.1 NAD(P)H-dependent FMN reductase [Oharaeibacter diazotrophicus]BBE73620.1 NADPH-dependent FMN reductase [Pleomorphomonas sp. SM30]GLS75409.1 FMN reductase [Oharaeibacter diazotrophicus]
MAVRPKILVFSGSIRAESFNARLAALAVKAIALRDGEPTLISLADYPMPIYDGDLEKAEGVPEAGRRLHDLMIAHAGVFIASPEYNQSVTPLLKNTIDWVSRIRPDGPRAPTPWKDRIFALGGASPGYFGATRSLAHLRHILTMSLGAWVLPDQVSVPSASTAFAPDGALASERAQAQLDGVVARLIEEAARRT